MGANTHRMSSNSPNLQNIPSTKEDKATKESLSGVKGRWGWECRDVFTVSDPRRFILVDADASGIQLRGLAHYGGDDEYIRLVSDPSIDIHDVHASVLGCSRAVAKTFIYAFLMGAGAKKLISILGGSDKELGEELLERFYKRFPFLKKFKKELDSQVEIGYYVALDGRLIALDREKPHKAMAVALQSFEVIIMKKALTFYHKDLNTRKIPFIQRLMVHDEFLTETLIEYKDEVGKAMANAIIKAGEYFGSKCPLDGKYKTGRTWAECH
jgi:DNA polymerase I-like protein with 3'-5' exonuclease and polymerase domains